MNLHEVPARVVVQLAMPTGWGMEQVESALRLLGQRVHAAAQGGLASAATWDGIATSRPGN